MGKRSAQASNAAPKRAKPAAASCQEDVFAWQEADQRGPRQAARAPAAPAPAPAAAAAAPSRQEHVAAFDPREWAQQQDLPDDLVKDLKQRFKDAMEVYDGCWSFVGGPMPKDAVLVNYERRKGFFRDGIRTLDKLRQAEAVQPKNGHQQVTLFHFGALLMDDKESNERFEVGLSDFVIIKEEKQRGRAEGGGTVEEELIGRVVEIFITVQGQRMVRLHWMYRGVDTPLAAGPKESWTRTKKNEVSYLAQLPSGDHLRHPRMVWLCGSEKDNDRYENCYPLESVDRKVRVVHIQPGYNHPREDPNFEGEFDDENDWFYNQYTVTDYLTFEDCWEDWTLFSARYLALWQDRGVEGIKQLRERCGDDLTSLMRGFDKKKLNKDSDKQHMCALELFAGAGGLSYICQRNDKVVIMHGYANDINNSAAATYTCNHPEAFTSACGLEEFTQLLQKWGVDVERFLGKDWQGRLKRLLKQLRNRPPRRKYARTHIPLGVGCWGTTMGKPGTSADAHLAAAERGEHALQQYWSKKGLQPPMYGSAEAEQEPDWDSLTRMLEDVRPVESSDYLSGDDYLPRPPELEDEQGGQGGGAASAASKQRMMRAFEQALQQQRQRVDDCRAFNKQHGRGKVLEVRDVTIKDCAVRVKHGSSRNQMEEGLTDWECWLEYEVRRERTGASSSAAAGSSSSEWAWEHQSLLWSRDAMLPMRRFMLRMLADKQIPMPGDVQLLTGGPPCQNVSGLNRHAKQQEVLNDPKNRLVTSYMNLIKYLQPNFILMEQVTDVYRKENAIYARYALALMVGSGYQARTGICTAGHYACSQGRRRAVFLGALSGKEQLPPFPAQTHECKPFNMGYPGAAQSCQVELPWGVDTKEAKKALHPFTLLGDNLSDLPAVSNFEEGDRLQYGRPPQSVSQAYLRRTPPSHERSLLERCIHADAAMAPWQQLQAKAQQILDEPEGEEKRAKILALGQRLLCKNKGEVALADLAGPPSQSSAAAAAATSEEDSGTGTSAAAAAAAGDKTKGKGGGSKCGSNAEEEEPSAANEDGDGDDDEDSAEERAEMAAELKQSRNFANETWKQHLKAYTNNTTKRELLHMLRQAELHNTQYVMGERKLHLMAAADKVDQEAATLRDHRPLLCNADDYGRMCAVPKEKGANFRDMAGVTTHEDGTCCSGSWHAAKKVASGKDNNAKITANLAKWRALGEEGQKKVKDPMTVMFKDVEMKCMCGAGGIAPKPPKGWKGKDGNDKHFRVDSYGSTANGAWRGSHLPGCNGKTYWLNTGDLLCPRWCITYKRGESNGRHGCYGRAWHDQIQPTVVTRAEPHNLELVHPDQDRVLSIRENARCQGFPDFHVFVGLAGGKGKNGSHGKGTATVDERYMQIGNAVAPPLAAALGRCLLLAATEDAPVGVPVVHVPDPEYESILQKCKDEGIGFWCEQPGNVVDKSARNEFYWARHLGEAAGGKGRSRGKKAAAQQQEQEQQEGEAGPAGAAAAREPAAGAAESSGGIPHKNNSKQKRKASSSTAGGAEAAGDAAAAPAADAPASKRKRSALSAAAAAAAEGAGSIKAAAAVAGAAGSCKAAAGAVVAAGPGRSSKRSAAAAASAAIKEGLQHEATPFKKLAEQAAARQSQQAGQGMVAAAAAAQQLLQQHQKEDGGPEDSPAAAAADGAAGAAAVQTEGGKSSARSSADLLGAVEVVGQQQQQPGSSGEDEEMDDAEQGSQDEVMVQ